MKKWLLSITLVIPALAMGQTPFLGPHAVFVNPNTGIACVGCALYSYAAGTTSAQPTYVDNTITTQNPNPVVLGTDGGANIWLANLPYKFALYTAPIPSGGVLIWTVDNVQAITFCASTGCTFTGPVTVSSLNKVIYVDQQTGATADAKFATACGLLPSTGGTLDARGFGSTTQTIAATVQCGSSTKPVTFLFDSSTVYQPSAVGTNMFQVSMNNTWRDLHIDTTNQATYSGNPISAASQSITWFRIDNTIVNMASGSTGPCINFTSTSPSIFIDFGVVSGLTCSGGTAAEGIHLANSGGGFLNSIHWSGIDILNTQYGFAMHQAGTGAITGHIVTDYFYEASSLATALSAVYMDATGHNGGNDLSFNLFRMQPWDLTGGNKAVIISAGSAGFACGNKFEGRLIAITDQACSVPNEYVDMFGGIATNTQEALGYVTISKLLTILSGANLAIANTQYLQFYDSGAVARNVLGLDNVNETNLYGTAATKKIFFYADGSSVSGEFNGNNSLFSLGNTWSFAFGGSQNLTGVQGTTGTKLLAATGSFTSGDLVKTDANGNAADAGAAPACTFGAINFCTTTTANGVWVHAWGVLTAAGDTNTHVFTVTGVNVSADCSVSATTAAGSVPIYDSSGAVCSTGSPVTFTYQASNAGITSINWSLDGKQ